MSKTPQTATKNCWEKVPEGGCEMQEDCDLGRGAIDEEIFQCGKETAIGKKTGIGRKAPPTTNRRKPTTTKAAPGRKSTATANGKTKQQPIKSNSRQTGKSKPTPNFQITTLPRSTATIKKNKSNVGNKAVIGERLAFYHCQVTVNMV